MEKLKVSFPPKLRPLTKPARYKILYGGRGSTKSWSVARMLLLKGASATKRILCTREIQNTISESVHQLLTDQIVQLGLTDFYEVTKHEIYGANGTQFLFTGLRTQDVTKIKSFEAFDICWVEEAQAVSKKSWEILIPTIRKEGSEIWVTFNPELDTDETYQRFVVHTPQNAILLKLNYSDNPWFPDVLEQERLDLKERDPVAYDNVWEGNCRTAVEGAIYASEVASSIENHRVRDVPHDPLLLTQCVWDLGWNDQMTIIMCQKAANSLMIIDYIEDSHRTYDSYVAELDSKPYRFAKDFLPHDGKHKDPKTGKSHIQILEALGRDVESTPDIGLEAGIKLARQTFPRVYFDKDRTGLLLEHLRRYKRQVNAQTQEAGAPVHDIHSHGSDAFRYMSVVADVMRNEKVVIKDPYAGFSGKKGWAG